MNPAYNPNGFYARAKGGSMTPKMNRRLAVSLGIMLIAMVSADGMKSKSITEQPKPIQNVADTGIGLETKVENYILASQETPDTIQAKKIAKLTIKEASGDMKKLKHLLAIFRAESKFNHNVRQSEKGAFGLGQVTDIAVVEYEQSTKKQIHPKKMEDNIKLASWTLDNIKNRYSKTKTDISLWVAYNGGLRGLRRYEAGKPLCRETRNYVAEVGGYVKELKGLL
jgi:hypothetical protein